jgi:nitroreductase
MQPYRFYWVESSTKKADVAKLCLGQMPAENASALVVAVADTGSMPATSRGQLEWMRRSEFSEAKIRDCERTARMAKEGLVSERKAKSGRAIHVQLTPRGNKYRERLIEARVAADENVQRQLTPEERATLLRLLKLITELEF